MQNNITIFSLNSYSIIDQSKESVSTIGGSEKRLNYLANYLLSKGCSVSYITYKNNVKNEKFTIIETYPVKNDLSYIYKIYTLLRAIRADKNSFYIYSTGSPGIMFLSRLLFRKKYVYLVSTDNILNYSDNNKMNKIKKILIFLDVNFSSIIVAQNVKQYQFFKDKKKNILLIKNPIIQLKNCNISIINKKKNRRIVWVGSIRKVKQPHLIGDIAKKLEKYEFIIIGGKVDNELDYYQKFIRSIEGVKNIRYIGIKNNNEVIQYIQNSTFLLNTSEKEGFPNTFLEAWYNYTPIISLFVNPDNLLTDNEIGFYCNNSNLNTNFLDKIVNEKYDSYAKASHSYVKKNHSIENFSELYTYIQQYFEE